METLAEIAFRYGTDKKASRHNFVAVYDPLFSPMRDRPLKLLEIGIYLCRSHNTWIDFFPNATIYGIDIVDDREKYARPRLVLDVVDQGNKEQLEKYAQEKGPWDIIIDDGSHLNSHQKASFEVLWKHVSPDGYYFLEDTHSSYWKKFIDCEETAMQYFLKLTDHICKVPHYKGYYSGINVRKQNETLDFHQETIEYINFRTGLLTVKKRK